MNHLITICARGGSKGLPKKNIKELNGVPLIGYSINQAFELTDILGNATIALSTDSDEIKSVAKRFGLMSDYNRPHILASDTAGKISVIRDLLNDSEERFQRRFDMIIDLDVSSPLRTCEEIKDAYSKILSDPNALNIFSVSPAEKNPYFNMVEVNPKGYAELVKKSTALSRQKAPLVYDMNASFYIYRREFFDLNLTSAITDYSLIYPMNHICFDIDEQIDFDIMEYLLSHGKIGGL